MHDEPKPTIAIIDLLRFAAAALVVAHHYATMFALSPPALIASSGAGPIPSGNVWWSWSGWVGVEIFFVISGYVIAMSAATGDGMTFLRRRILRLAPAAWICASGTAVLILLADPFGRAGVAWRWLASITFWPIAPQIDAPYWTLGIELAFYMLVASQLGGRRNHCAAIERLGWLLAIATLIYWPLSGAWSPLANSSRGADILLLAHGGCFATGIALWAIRNGGTTRARLAMLALALAGAAIEIAHCAAFMAHGLGLAVGPAVPLTLFAIAVALLAAARPLQAPVARLVGVRRLALLGKITYPLYLIHFELGAVVVVALRLHGAAAAPALLIAALTSMTLATAIAAYAEPALRVALAALLSRRGPWPNSPPSAFPPAG